MRPSREEADPVWAPPQLPVPECPLSGLLMMPEIPTINISLKIALLPPPNSSFQMLGGISLSCHFLCLTAEGWTRSGLHGKG